MPAPTDARLELAAGDVAATVLPGEGGVLIDLRVAGLSVLTATPWADDVRASAAPAPDETAWVERWRGGWQVNLPTAGDPDPSEPGQGFHGAASQAPWSVAAVEADSAELTWTDGELTARRVWRLTADGATATTTLENTSGAPRRILVAEHLVLGGDVLAHPLALETDAVGLQPLSYDAAPAGPVVPWPGDPDERWATVDPATPARVGGIVDASRVVAVGPHLTATVTWSGLPHALLWEELGVSTGHPWNGGVRALGIEPTSRPHGAGTAAPDAPVLAPGETLTWTATLAVRPGGTA